MEKSIKSTNPIEFIKNHKTEIITVIGAGVAITAAAFIVTVFWVGNGFHHDFLKEKGLSDEFRDFVNKK